MRNVRKPLRVLGGGKVVGKGDGAHRFRWRSRSVWRSASEIVGGVFSVAKATVPANRRKRESFRQIARAEWE
jgi:hypothetical protein